MRAKLVHSEVDQVKRRRVGFLWAIFLTGIRIKPHDCMAGMMEY